MHQQEIVIRWRDIDAIEHVNNAVYLTYLEEAEDAAQPFVPGDADVTRYVIARIEIDFRSQLRQSDRRAVVSCRLESIGGSSFRSAERIAKPDGEVAATAACVLVAWERTGRSRPLEAWERRALERALLLYAEPVPADPPSTPPSRM